MPQSQSAQSLKYVRCPITVTVNGAPRDPTGDVAQMGFATPGGTPTWYPASWETDPVRQVHWVICLVGPGGTAALAAGQWDVWIRIVDNPEIPKEPVDTLTIY